MASWLEDWEAWLRAGDRDARTVRAYVRDVAAFCAWFRETEGRDPEPQDLTVASAAEFKAHLRRLGRRPATVNRALAALRLVARWQGRALDGLRDDREQDLAPRALPAPVLEALLAAARRRPLRDQLLLRLMADLGLRVGEVVALDAGDVSLPRGQGLAVLTLRGKGGKLRQLPLPPQLAELVRRYLRTLPADGPLFPGRQGGRLTTKAVRDLLKRLARAAGLDPREIHPHRLRHTCATELLRDGAPVTHVAALLGHARLDVTARYTRPNLDDLGAWIARRGRR